VLPHGRSRIAVLAIALAVIAAVALMSHAPRTTEARVVHAYTAPLLAPGRRVVRFRVHGVRPNAIRRGTIRIGSRRLRIRPRRLRRGLHGSLLKLSLRPRWAARARVQHARLSLVTRSFAEFDGLSTARGSLSVSADHYYDAPTSVRAHYGGGLGGFQRVWREVRWRRGSDVWFGMALYVPDSTAYCYWNPIRWDNFKTYGGGGDLGGLTVYQGRITLMQSRYGGGERDLVGPVPLPQGRWTWLQLHQRFSGQDGAALSELYVDGRRVGASRRANSLGRPINHVRFGVVNVSGKCSRPSDVLFDRVRLTRGFVAPLPAALQKN
jgi:hypothetical protein